MASTDLLDTLSKHINLQNSIELFINLARAGHVELVEAFIKLGVDVHAGLRACSDTT
jgi:hypothetical protein